MKGSATNDQTCNTDDSRRGVKHRSPCADLTRRECEVVQLTANGYTAEAAAEQLGTSKKTIEAHLANARHKLDARSGAQLVAEALRKGIIIMVIGSSVANMAALNMPYDAIRLPRTTKTRKREK